MLDPDEFEPGLQTSPCYACRNGIDGVSDPCSVCQGTGQIRYEWKVVDGVPTYIQHRSRDGSADQVELRL